MARSGNNPDDHIKLEDNTWKIVINDTAQLSVDATGIVSASLSTVVLSASTAQATLTAKQHFALADATSANFGITLPAAADATGKTYTVKKVDVSSNSVFLSGASSETIEGSATLELDSAGESVSVTSDSIQWHVTAFYSGALGV